MHLQALIQELYQGYTKIWESKGEQNRESLLLGNSYNRVVEEETQVISMLKDKCQ